MTMYSVSFPSLARSSMAKPNVFLVEFATVTGTGLITHSLTWVASRPVWIILPRRDVAGVVGPAGCAVRAEVANAAPASSSCAEAPAPPATRTAMTAAVAALLNQKVRDGFILGLHQGY